MTATGLWVIPVGCRSWTPPRWGQAEPPSAVGSKTVTVRVHVTKSDVHFRLLSVISGSFAIWSKNDVKTWKKNLYRENFVLLNFWEKNSSVKRIYFILFYVFHTNLFWNIQIKRLKMSISTFHTKQDVCLGAIPAVTTREQPWVTFPVPYFYKMKLIFIFFPEWHQAALVQSFLVWLFSRLFSTSVKVSLSLKGSSGSQRL